MNSRTRPQAPKIEEPSEFIGDIHTPSVSSPRPHAVLELTEEKMNKIVESLGLSGWIVVWEPNPTEPNRGQILPESKTIIIHDEEPEDALKTLLHEVVELKLRPVLRLYRSLANALLNWADEQVYYEKEKAIDDLISFFLKFIEDGYPSERNYEEV
jgi:hypothetical protein